MRKKGKALRPFDFAQDEREGSADAAGVASSGRTDVAASPPLPDFTPVPRRFRHDGWTPERQKAFILRQAQDERVLRCIRSS